MCLNNCKKVNNETEITCYKYVVIKYWKNSEQIFIHSPFHGFFKWNVPSMYYYSNPMKEDYPSDINKNYIGAGFFHVLASTYTAIKNAHEYCDSCETGEFMAVIECVIPDRRKADTFYGNVNNTGEVGYATTHLKTSKIVYLDKPVYSWNKRENIFYNIKMHGIYRRKMRMFNKIKKHFSLDDSNCQFTFNEENK